MVKNKRELTGLLLIIAAVISTVLISGCVQEESEKKWEINSDKFVFIEHRVHIHGELIEGNASPGLMIDFPTYSFDEKTGILNGQINFDINKQLKVIYGNGESLSGTAGGGVATGLLGIYYLPYEGQELKILKIDSDGTAHIEYNNISIFLKTGEDWLNTTSKIDARDLGWNKYKVNLTTTDKIVNYGILDKSNIQKWQ